jgi:hypothetical protein
MSDFVVVRASHTFLMRSRRVLKLTVAFIKTGSFSTEQSAPLRQPWRAPRQERGYWVRPQQPGRQ